MAQVAEFIFKCILAGFLAVAGLVMAVAFISILIDVVKNIMGILIALAALAVIGFLVIKLLT